MRATARATASSARSCARSTRINPQIAARLAGAFENWRRYDAARQGLMRAELEAVAKMEGLSSNLYEVATKMLG